MTAHTKCLTPMPSASRSRTRTFEFLAWNGLLREHKSYTSSMRSNIYPRTESQQWNEVLVSKTGLAISWKSCNDDMPISATRQYDGTNTRAVWGLKACIRKLLQWLGIIPLPDRNAAALEGGRSWRSSSTDSLLSMFATSRDGLSTYLHLTVNGRC